MMLFVSEPFRSNLILTYFAGAVGATLLELVTGIVMESIFKIKYWDYSSKKYNYKGVYLPVVHHCVGIFYCVDE